MKFLNFHRKPISMYVAIAFLAMVCFWANQAPAAPKAPAPDKGSSASMEKQEGDGTGFIETEESAPHAKSGKKFPWLIAAVVVIAGGAALYFFVLKKKNYTLTVNVGEGVTGTPAAGSTSNKKGTVINYNYSLQNGYDNLSVTLDGAAIAASGTVTMNANHTLEAKATKTFVLTVSRGEHVTGSPASGTYSYARGSNVSYSYTPESGYSNLDVKLDNIAAAASGTIAMNDNHTLTANLYGANLAVNSTPAGAHIYLDNVDSGHFTPYTFTFNSSVTKIVHLRYSCGYKEHRETVSVALGQTKTINATLLPGIMEYFVIPASSCWYPYNPSDWTTPLENYRYIGSASNWDTNVYNYSFSGDYSVVIWMDRVSGSNLYSNSIFLGTGNNMTNASGYAFQYTCDGRYSIYRFTNYNFINATGPLPTALRSWTLTPAIVQGINKFNSMKVAKSGSNYAFYINNTLVTSITDATYNPTYLALIFNVGGVHTQIQYNSVNLTLGGAAIISATCSPLNAMPATGEERDQTGGIVRK